MDKDKLAKLMAMTTSDNDHEALAALRLANRMLVADKVTWQQVLAGGEKQLRVTLTHAYETRTDENWVAPHLKDKVMIELMFRALFGQPRTGNDEFWETMESIHGWWLKHGSLTQNQYNALRNCYKRIIRKSG